MSLYYHPREPGAKEIAIKHRIGEIYTNAPFYGSCKITKQFRREGVVINRKTVQRHMHETGIVAIYPGPNLSRRQHKEHIYPYLLRRLAICCAKYWLTTRNSYTSSQAAPAI